MFTGCIEATGKIYSRVIEGKRGELTISAELAKELRDGDSIAVNGACLTVEEVDRDGDIVKFHAMAETLHRTNLGSLADGCLVNLERALCLGDRLHGHLVTGHIDCTTPVLKIDQDKEDHVIELLLPREFAALVIPKGSITVDGVSLTITTLTQRSFSVHLIPYTLTHTNLSERRVADPVNLEMDLFGKYILRSQEVGNVK
jgi:riboflavin synthase